VVPDCKEWHPKEEAHKTAERQYWSDQVRYIRRGYYFSIFTFVVAVAAAFIAAGAYFQTKRQADIAQAIVVATDRARIIAQRMEITGWPKESDPHLYLRITIENVGKSVGFIRRDGISFIAFPDSETANNSFPKRVCGPPTERPRLLAGHRVVAAKVDQIIIATRITDRSGEWGFDRGTPPYAQAFGYIDYDDPFSETLSEQKIRTEPFCFIFDGTVKTIFDQSFGGRIHPLQSDACPASFKCEDR
jgi:hypothetical protein